MLIIDAAEDLNLTLSRKGLKEISRRIGLLKANNKLPNEADNVDIITKKLYERYEQLLEFNNAIDLDGLIMRVVRILPTIDINVNAKIKHVLVDEYQDINQSEFLFIKMLTNNVESLFVVGDDDQSIYSWRGADPSIIRNFSKDFEDSHIEILEESHRCTEHIIKGAQSIVSKDTEYVNKPICSVKGEGSPIHILLSRSWIVEADWIARWIKDHTQNGSFSPSSIVILCKTLNLAEALAEQLTIQGIDTVYWRSGGLFTRDLALDILAHIRLLVDKDDNLALRRCTRTKTGYGIGYTCIRNIRRIAEKYSCSLWDVMIRADGFMDLRMWQTPIRRFTEKINEIERISSKIEPHEIIGLIAKEIGMSGRADATRLQEFAKSSSKNNIQDFLGEVVKNRGLDLAGGVPEPEEKREIVTIMSMHSAKGLTYDVVFLLGMDQDILPDPKQDLNEQRRLCYVAMTRARKELFLCSSKSRKGPAVHGWSFFNPSRFLDEIPNQHKEIISAI
jgi:DNA helicase-2/ATP-dependent DNA helicase PcrA